MSQLIEKVYNYCFRILSLKPYTESDIRKKIQNRFKEIQAEMVDEVLLKLKEFKYINDSEFAENYIAFRTKISPRGKFLLKQELIKKGVASQIIEDTIENSEINEITLAQQLVEHKSKALQSFEPQKRKEKLMRFLLSRGFNYGVIKEVL